MSNLHKVFYKDYYTNVGFELKEKGRKMIVTGKSQFPNDTLFDAVVETNPVSVCDEIYSIPLKTLYPGLITGVGIDHEAGIEGEFKLGVHFDYTYGMPVIYGSSVKGVLRTYFQDFAKVVFNDFTKDDLQDFEKDIFEGKTKNNEGKYSNKSIYARDIFFDAAITNKNEKGKILDSDTLCPHRDNPLKNPIPISFLKIASGVTIEFRFKLETSKIGNKKITAQEKKDIFENILTTVGIGAKTNVGYGQFTCNE